MTPGLLSEFAVTTDAMTRRPGLLQLGLANGSTPADIPIISLFLRMAVRQTPEFGWKKTLF
jgi:hypothetical protein